jgi:thiol-disulfide isomerase/thioredoxin
MNEHHTWMVAVGCCLLVTLGLLFIAGRTAKPGGATAPAAPPRPLDVAERIYASDPARQMIGMEVPDVALTDIVSGRTLSPDDLKRRVTLINTLVIGCPSCLQEIAKLNQLHEKYGDRLQIIALDISPRDTPAQLLDVKKSLNGGNYIWTIAPDAAKALTMEGPDYTYIIENGKVVYADSFVVPVERLDRFVQEALG